MTMTRKKKIALLAASVVVTLGAGVSGVLILLVPAPIVMPEELTVEALEQQWDDPARLMRHVHKAIRQNNLTGLQQQQLQANMLYVWEQRTNQRVDEYLAASEAEREAILDRHLDAMQQRRAEADRQRAAFRQEVGMAGSPSEQAGGDRGVWPASPSTSGAAEGDPPARGSTRQERKECSESSDPDWTARWMAYFTALRKRADARGLDFPSRSIRRGG
jgi:hypothetical protein